VTNSQVPSRNKASRLAWILLIKHGVVIMDLSNGEYARVATLTKLYQNLVLGTKAYVKSIIKKYPYFDKHDIQRIKIPYMGFKVVVSVII
jgi:hypothetical protein